MKSQVFTEGTFSRREDGGLSVLNLFFLMATGIVAGVAIDVSSLVSAKSQLQVTADAAAHAALVEREWNDSDTSRATAVALAQQNMPTSRFGDVLSDDNIFFGTYDRGTDVFDVDDTSRDAVLVKTERLTSNGNPVSSFLLQFAGFWNWDVRATSVFETFYPTCLIEGFVAEDVIDIQSNNSYFNGFCIHSNNYVTINNNNFFEPGTIVSMPDSDDIVVSITGNGEDKNEGLEEALREGKWFIKILDRIDRIAAGLQDEDSRYARDYITDYTVISIDQDMKHLRQGQKYVIEPADLTKGRIYTLKCNQLLDLVNKGTGIFEDIVLIADCPIQVSGGLTIRNATVITTYNGDNAFKSPANIVLGEDDSCGVGGGAQLLTKGNVDFSAGVEMYGSQIIAGGSVEFTSNADGLQGASIVAGNRIDSTSNMNFSFCGSGMEHSFMAEYFRLVN